jgi:hypothetical protein
MRTYKLRRFVCFTAQTVKARSRVTCSSLTVVRHTTRQPRCRCAALQPCVSRVCVSSSFAALYRGPKLWSYKWCGWLRHMLILLGACDHLQHVILSYVWNNVGIIRWQICPCMHTRASSHSTSAPSRLWQLQHNDMQFFFWDQYKTCKSWWALETTHGYVICYSIFQTVLLRLESQQLLMQN